MCLGRDSAGNAHSWAWYASERWSPCLKLDDASCLLSFEMSCSFRYQMLAQLGFDRSSTCNFYIITLRYSSVIRSWMSSCVADKCLRFRSSEDREDPRVQKIDKTVDVTVVMQRQAPAIQTKQIYKSASHAYCCVLSAPCDRSQETTAETSYSVCCGVGTPGICSEPPLNISTANVTVVLQRQTPHIQDRRQWRYGCWMCPFWCNNSCH